MEGETVAKKSLTFFTDGISSKTCEAKKLRLCLVGAFLLVAKLTLNHILPQFHIFILQGFSETIDAGNRGFRSIAAAGRRYAALVAGG